MQVEDERSQLASVDGCQSPAGQPIWQQSKVSASRDGEPASKKPRRRQRPLDDGFSLRRGHSVRSPFGVRNAIAIVAHGKNTRIVDESEFHQNIEGPARLAYDGIARSAISLNPRPGNI